MSMQAAPERNTSHSWTTGGAMDWLGPLLTGLIIATIPLLHFLLSGDSNLSLYLQNDDAMRLVQVRDLIAGQGWYDLTQYRLGIDGGVPMHWSRLVDAPIALIILGLGRFVGMATAETAAAVIWPALVALPAVAANVAAGGFLAGRYGAWTAAILTGWMLRVSDKFYPGAFDHHSVQLTLLIVATALAIHGFRSAKAAGWLGATLALSVAVGVETLPYVVALAAAITLAWVVRGAAQRANLIAFTSAITLALLMLFVAAAPSEAYRGGFCDALSRDILLPVVLGASALLLAATRLQSGGIVQRLVAAIASAAVAGTAAILFAPACLQDPFAALDPLLRDLWLGNVVEALTARQAMASGYAMITTIVLMGGAAGAVALGYATRPRNRGVWLLLVWLVTLALAMSFWQIRNVSFIAVLVVLPFATCTAALFERARETRRVWPALGAMILLFGLSDPGITGLLKLLHRTGAGGTEQMTTSQATNDDGPPNNFVLCGIDDRLALLASLPRGRVATSSNLGAHILAQTSHSTISAPYHRNTAGMLAQLKLAIGTVDAAEDQLRALGIDYVVACNTEAEYHAPGRIEASAFFPALERGEVPDFLIPVEGSPMRYEDGTEIGVFRLRE